MSDRRALDVCSADAMIGESVSACRIKMGLPLIDVASHLEMAVGDYLEAESGDLPFLVVDIVKLADLFGVAIKDLMPNQSEFLE